MPAHAEIAFTPPEALFSNATGGPEIAVDGQGLATVVALEPASEGPGTLVQVVRTGSTGLPGTAHTLEEVPPGQCVCPKLAAAPTGEVLVIWHTTVEGVTRVAGSIIGADGVPQPRQLLSPPEVDGIQAGVAAGSEGSFAVAWKVSGDEGGIEAVLIGAEGNIGDVHPVSEVAGRQPQVAAGPDGAFRVAWNDRDGISTAPLDDEGAPGAVQPVSPDGSASNLSGIVVDSNGVATIAWGRSDLSDARAVRLDAGGTLGEVLTLQPPDENVTGPKIAIDGQDRVTAAWQSFDSRVFALRLAADGTPGTVHQISPEGRRAGSPQIAAAPDGRVVVAWHHPVVFSTPEESCGVTELDYEDDVVRAAVIGSDGVPLGAHDVSLHGEEAVGTRLALDPLGLPWIAWESLDGGYFCEVPMGRIQFSHASEPPPLSGEGPIAPPVGAGPPPPAPTLRLAKRGFARDGVIRIRARCNGPAGGTCAGPIRLATSAPERPLARGRYRLAAGTARTLTFSIVRGLRRSLFNGGPDWISASASGKELTAKSVRIRVRGVTP
ncbi:MAG TPA: hypothetical protein VFN18_08465 [Solirubrobacterales bacterium]|nr:hypothetical protein [Solirubrobacterales bacterium]